MTHHKIKITVHVFLYQPFWFRHQLTHHTNQVAKDTNKLMKDLAHLTVPSVEQVSAVIGVGGVSEQVHTLMGSLTSTDTEMIYTQYI